MNSILTKETEFLSLPSKWDSLESFLNFLPHMTLYVFPPLYYLFALPFQALGELKKNLTFRK